MKKLLSILLCLPMFGLVQAQTRYLDDVFSAVTVTAEKISSRYLVCPNPIIGKQSNISSSFFILVVC